MGEKSETRMALETRATDLGLKFPKNIGDDKLTARIAEAEALSDGDQDNTVTPEIVAANQGESGANGPSLDPDTNKPTEITALVVVVTGPPKGRWRCGRLFGSEPVEIPLEELTEGEKEALIADTSLTVSTQPAKSK